MNTAGESSAAAIRMERLMTAREVASVLGISRSRVYQLAESGRLPHIRIGALLRFHPADIRRVLEEGIE